MSNYPDGATSADIDRHFGGARDDWPFVLECLHLQAIDELAYQRDCDPEDVHDFDGTQTIFKDDETEELSSWTETWGASCRWRCPVCHVEHEEDVDKEDFYDDRDDDD